MSDFKPIQFSFGSGEIDPSHYGRMDLPFRRHAAKRIENFVVNASGGVTRRPGTIHVGELDSSTNTRLFSHRYSDGEDYLFVVLDETVHVYHDDEKVDDFELGFSDGFTISAYGNILFVAHPNHPLQKITRDDDSFSIDEAKLLDGPYLSPKDDLTWKIIEPAEENWNRVTIKSSDPEEFLEVTTDIRTIGTGSLSNVLWDTTTGTLWVAKGTGEDVFTIKKEGGVWVIMKKVGPSDWDTWWESEEDGDVMDSVFTPVPETGAEGEFTLEGTDIVSFPKAYEYETGGVLYFGLSLTKVDNSSIVLHGFENVVDMSFGTSVPRHVLFQYQEGEFEFENQIYTSEKSFSQALTGSFIKVVQGTTHTGWYELMDYLGVVEQLSEKYPLAPEPAEGNNVSVDVFRSVFKKEGQEEEGRLFRVAGIPKEYLVQIKDYSGHISIEKREVELILDSGRPHGLEEPDRMIRFYFRDLPWPCKIEEVIDDNRIRVIGEVPMPLDPNDPRRFYNKGEARTYQLGAFYPDNHPAVVTFHEQRMILAATPDEPQKFWGSVTGEPLRFSPTELSGLMLDSSGFSYLLASGLSYPIQWGASSSSLILEQGTENGWPVHLLFRSHWAPLIFDWLVRPEWAHHLHSPYRFSLPSFIFQMTRGLWWSSDTITTSSPSLPMICLPLPSTSRKKGSRIWPTSPPPSLSCG